jgi:hypothetical protein
MGSSAVLPLLAPCNGITLGAALNAASADAAPYTHDLGWTCLSRKVHPVELVSVPPSTLSPADCEKPPPFGVGSMSHEQSITPCLPSHHSSLAGRSASCSPERPRRRFTLRYSPTDPIGRMRTRVPPAGSCVQPARPSTAHQRALDCLPSGPQRLVAQAVARHTGVMASARWRRASMTHGQGRAPPLLSDATKRPTERAMCAAQGGVVPINYPLAKARGLAPAEGHGGAFRERCLCL